MLKVKKIVTLVVMLVFVVQTMRGEIGADSVMYVVGTVIAFYFGSERNGGEN